jgi:hypothetical protein
VHGSIREAPEWISLVGQKVGRNEGIVIWPNDIPAERTIGSAGFDPLHRRKMKLFPAAT